MIPKYIGNGAYCYANSTSMLLKSSGFDCSPSLIEVLSGLGNGCFIRTDIPIAFFSNFATCPEDGINNALNLLEFKYEEKGFTDEKTAFTTLKKAIKKGPVLIGPIDIAYMSHWGNSKNEGGDHYVLAYKITKDTVWIHDPQEFPSTPLPISDFLKIWKAENISFKEKQFHFWTDPKRKSAPSPLSVFNNALALFKQSYIESRNHPETVKIDEDALLDLSKRVKKPLPPFLVNHLTGFAFPVIIRRSLDYAAFFRVYKKEKLAKIKEKQAELFSTCQVYSKKQEWEKVSNALEKLAKVEVDFKKTLFEYKRKKIESFIY